jgi:hypothetical protein
MTETDTKTGRTTRKKSEKPEKEEYEIPELQVRIPKSWIRLIVYCQRELADGQLCVKINNSEPGDLVSQYTEKRIRFDREPRTGSESIINFGGRTDPVSSRK